MKKAFEVVQEWKAQQPSAQQILGSPPWTREQLEKAYFADFQRIWEALKFHPGHALYDHIECLTRSFALFDLSVRDLLNAIYRFELLFRERGIPSRRRDAVIEEIKLDLEKNLFASTQAALALVEHSRRISRKVKVAGYTERTTAFANDPAHQFLQGLRNCLFHVFYISPNWEMRGDPKAGDKAHFTVTKKELLRFGEWNTLARRYLEAMEEKLDVGKLLREYREKVRGFQSWFVAQLRHYDPISLADYLEARRVIHAAGSRSAWNLMLQQVVIQQGRDAFDYLDRFLEPSELERVYRLPFRSKAQIDFIIALLDEHGACDDKLRQIAYRAFKIPE